MSRLNMLVLGQLRLRQHVIGFIQMDNPKADRAAQCPEP